MAINTNKFAPNDDEKKFKQLIDELMTKRKDPNYVKYVMDREGYNMDIVNQELENRQQFEANGTFSAPVQEKITSPDQLEVDQSQLTGEQNKALGFGKRTFASGKIINELESSIAEKGAFGAIEQSIDEFQVGKTLTNRFVGEEFQKFDQAKRDFVNAQLRRESGAAIADSEFESAEKQYFPVPGDSEAVVLQKRKNRELAVKSLLGESGIDISTLSFEDNQKETSLDSPEQAIEWLKENPDDPRAEQVRAKLEGIGQQAVEETVGAIPAEKGIGSKLGDRVSNVYETLKDQKGRSFFENIIRQPETMLRAAGQVAGGALDIGEEVLGVLYDKAVPERVKEEIKTTAVNFLETEAGQDAISALQKGEEAWGKFKESYPDAAKDLEAAGNIAMAVPGAKGAGMLYKEGKAIAGDALELSIRTFGKDAVKKSSSDIFRAIKPSITVKRNKMNIQGAMEAVNAELVRRGVKPTDLKSYAEGIANTKNQVWGEVEKAIGGGEGLQVNLKQISDKMFEMGMDKNLLRTNPTAAKKIQEMAKNLLVDGESISVRDAEVLKQLINSDLKGAFGKFNLSNAEQNAKKLMTSAIGDQMDTLLSKVPEEFSGLKKMWGNMTQVEEDVMKRLIVFERQNPQGLVESFSKISGIGNIVKGFVPGGGGASSIARGVGELALGKIQKNANDANLLIKKAFENISKRAGDFEPRSIILEKLKNIRPGMNILEVNEGITQTLKNLEIAKKNGNKREVEILEKEYKKLVKERNLFNSKKGNGEIPGKLELEAKKYKTADEFVKAQGKIKDSHVAPSGKGEKLSERLDYEGDVTLREELSGHYKQPDDFFHGFTGPRAYGYDSFYGRETLDAIRKGKDIGEITIYRAVPKNINKINDEEWIYFVKKQADEHGKNRLQGDYKILEKKVSIDDVWWDGNDIREWGYDSGKNQIKSSTHSESQLTDIWNKAHGR